MTISEQLSAIERGDPSVFVRREQAAHDAHYRLLIEIAQLAQVRSLLVQRPAGPAEFAGEETRKPRHQEERSSAHAPHRSQHGRRNA